ncbi:AraC family transcriptional regulator [Agrobacterium tumefaciens]|uniref:helix-turn-helix transcriptional regulator n=1 Tax=Agrobacterium tumefaciens TaxID=358 RepID=UPI003B9F494A
MSVAVDPLSQLLNFGGAHSAPSTGLKARGAWSIRVPHVNGLKCNAVRRGNCILQAEGKTWCLSAGDCFLIAPDLEFVIASDPNCAPREASDVFAHCGDHPFAVLDEGDGPEFFCLGGRMDLPKAAALVTSSLPPVTIVKAGSATAGRISWLFDRLEAEQCELGPGSAAMFTPIMQMVFIELIRSLPDGEGRGWLAALRDPRIGPAIVAIHRDPRPDWRLEDLARMSNLSRSQFAARFQSAVGVAPIHYLLQWRMTLARKALGQTGMTIANVAADFGYASESAFGVAFRRVFGTTPRRAALADQSGATLP